MVGNRVSGAMGKGIETVKTVEMMGRLEMVKYSFIRSMSRLFVLGEVIVWRGSKKGMGIVMEMGMGMEMEMEMEMGDGLRIVKGQQVSVRDVMLGQVVLL